MSEENFVQRIPVYSGLLEVTANRGQSSGSHQIPQALVGHPNITRIYQWRNNLAGVRGHSSLGALTH